MFHFHILVTQFAKQWYLLSNTYISKNVLKCILKHVVFQYYAMKSKNFLLLMTDLNYIHGFSILRYNLLIIFQKKLQVSLTGIFMSCLCHGRWLWNNKTNISMCNHVHVVFFYMSNVFLWFCVMYHVCGRQIWAFL
jgi:hypothetical protein